MDKLLLPAPYKKEKNDSLLERLGRREILAYREKIALMAGNGALCKINVLRYLGEFRVNEIIRTLHTSFQYIKYLSLFYKWLQISMKLLNILEGFNNHTTLLNLTRNTVHNGINKIECFSKTDRDSFCQFVAELKQILPFFRT